MFDKMGNVLDTIVAALESPTPTPTPPRKGEGSRTSPAENKHERWRHGEPNSASLAVAPFGVNDSSDARDSKAGEEIA